MKGLKSVIIASLALILPMSCAVNNLPDSQPELFSLSGQWVVVNDSKLMDEVMFDFRKKGGERFNLKVWGENAQLKSVTEQNDQIIFVYETEKKQEFSVLAQVLDYDRIKLSTVEDRLSEFQPVGKLGERVFHLQKRTQGDLKLITKMLKKK